MSVLLAVLFLLTAAAGTGVVLTRQPRRQALALGVNGLVLSLLFMALQAPDVAFSELAVGTAAVPLLFRPRECAGGPAAERRSGMSRNARIVLFALAVLALLPAVVRVSLQMPQFGNHPLPYGDAINRDAPQERHVTNMVTAVNFDYRGLDTLGEEFMLFCAVTGAVMLLRGSRGENVSARAGWAPGRPIPARTEAIALIGRWLGPLLMLFGTYVVVHAQLTPGGGFQGGAIIGSGLLLYYLGEGYGGWRRLVRSRILLAAEAGGAAAFALAGFGPMLVGGKFLENVLPLGQMKALLSGGLILVVNGAVAFAVAGGFGLLFIEFMEETRAEEGGEK